MQQRMDFGASADLRQIQGLLTGAFSDVEPPLQRTPMEQLVKSLISNRTYDRVSLEAYEQLVANASPWAVLAEQSLPELQARIAAVEFADRKAQHLKATLNILGGLSPPFDLDFLGAWPMADALAWMERLPGVGRKVAASVLNFSTLQRPALVIDTHLKRVLHRLGFVGSSTETQVMYDAMMQAADGWTADEFVALHVGLKRLGQTCCRPGRLSCDDCPLAACCRLAAKRATDG